MLSYACLIPLILGALTPTTSHEQVRDGKGRAWMLIRSKKVLVLHAPDAGQLQVSARSAGAKQVRIRAGGRIITKQALGAGDEAALPGQSVGAVVVLRAPVPSGGEIFRIEVPRGRAWVSVDLITPRGVQSYEQMEAPTPGLVGLAPVAPGGSSGMPGLVGLVPPKPVKEAGSTPGLVALGGGETKKKDVLSLGDRGGRNVPTLAPIEVKPTKEQGPAAIDRPITELPTDAEPAVVVKAPSKEPKPEPQPAQPTGPTLMERFAQLKLPVSLAGQATGRADRVGGQLEVEVGLPGMLSAAMFVGYSPSQRVGVVRRGAGVALPNMLTQSTQDVPIGLALRARPLSRQVAGRPVALTAELQAGMRIRSSTTTLSSASASQNLSLVASGGAFAAALGLGAEIALNDKLAVGLSGLLDAGPSQTVAHSGIVEGAIGQLGLSGALSLRYRMGR